MLSAVWSIQRGSQSYIEKRRGRKEIKVTRRRGGVKRRETDLQLVLLIKQYVLK